MPFSPIDLQVTFQQAGRVADEAASAENAQDRAESDRAQEQIEERRLQENISDDSDESQGIDEESQGNAGGYYSGEGESEEEEGEEENIEARASQNSPEDPGKGSFLDVTT